MKQVIKRWSVDLKSMGLFLNFDEKPTFYDLEWPHRINPGETVLMEMKDGEWVVKAVKTEYPKFRRQKRSRSK